MKDLFLAADKFEGRLNMEIFTNIEKAITPDKVQMQYPNHVILEKSDIDAFIKNTYESIGGEIKKGGFNDTKEVHGYLKKAAEQLKAVKPINLLEKGEVRKIYLLKKPEDVLKKGETVKKGMISESFDFYSNTISFTKKGSDIKTKLAGVKGGILGQMEIAEKEIEELAGVLISVPTEKRRGYGFSEGVVCPYNVFKWEKTYCGKNDSSYKEYGEDAIDCCETPEEARANALYNDAVYKWMELAGEKKAIEMYEENLADSKVYDLTARQMIALGY